MYDIWNEMGVSEIKEQYLASQVRSIFKSKKLEEIEI